MTISVRTIRRKLKEAADTTPEAVSYYFKTGKGDYAEHERFMGVRTGTLRRIAKELGDLNEDTVFALLASKFNEERQLALFVLVNQYKQADQKQKDKIYRFYLKHKHCVNNWNLIDTSAHLIVGAHLLEKDKSSLIKLAQSDSLWDRRIAMVATWCFIKNDKFSYTKKLAKLLLKDSHDLMHKASGWMLREMGKRNEDELIGFLDKHCLAMPRTMLRYAIERLPEKTRLMYLRKR